MRPQTRRRFALVPCLLVLAITACGAGVNGAADAYEGRCHSQPSWGNEFFEQVAGATLDQFDEISGESYAGRLNDPLPQSEALWIQLFAGWGVFADGVEPGVYTLGAEFTDECGACVRVMTNLSAGEYEDDGYFAYEGTLTITSLLPRITGTLENAVFTHIQISPDTFEETPHPDGCTTTIEFAEFDALVQTQ